MSYVTWLTINRQCNLHCYWCYQKELLSSTSQMSLGLAERLIDLAIGMGSGKVLLIGGEPTIHPDFLDIVRYVHDVEVGVLTNGIAFANEVFCERAISAGLTDVSTSLKGTNETEYAEHCGNGLAFRKVLRAIENLDRSRLRHQISVTVNRAIIRHWQGMADFVRNHPTSTFAFTFERPVMAGDAVIFEDDMMPGNLASFIERVIYPSLVATHADFTLNLTVPLCHFTPGFVEGAQKAGHVVSGCQLIMDNGIIFDPEGRVLTCNHDVDHPLGAYGDDFVTVEDMRAWRESADIRRFYQLMGAPPSTQCETCPTWETCGAGCRMFWLYKGQEVLIPVESVLRVAR